MMKNSVTLQSNSVMPTLNYSSAQTARLPNATSHLEVVKLIKLCAKTAIVSWCSSGMCLSWTAQVTIPSWQQCLLELPSWMQHYCWLQVTNPTLSLRLVSIWLPSILCSWNTFWSFKTKSTLWLRTSIRLWNSNMTSLSNFKLMETPGPSSPSQLSCSITLTLWWTTSVAFPFPCVTSHVPLKWS